MLQKYAPTCLLGINSDTCVCYNCTCCRINAKLFSHKFDYCCEWCALWDWKSKIAILCWKFTYVLKGSLGSEAFVILKVTFCCIAAGYCCCSTIFIEIWIIISTRSYQNTSIPKTQSQLNSWQISVQHSAVNLVFWHYRNTNQCMNLVKTHSCWSTLFILTISRCR